MIGLLCLACSLAALVVSPAFAQSEPPPRMPPTPDRLAPPPTVYPPTQADDGAQLYYQICMVCHGDRGQGLTDEWRGVLDILDQDCWQSRCHASNHPPDGFVFPKAVPAVISPGTVARFENGLELYTFLKTRMPWQAPGSRSDEEYWQLTAYLLRANGIQPPDPLNAQNAASVMVRASLFPGQIPSESSPQKTVTPEGLDQEEVVSLPDDAAHRTRLLAMTNNRLWLVGLAILLLIPLAFFIKRLQ
jgi:cytochrome c5